MDGGANGRRGVTTQDGAAQKSMDYQILDGEDQTITFAPWETSASFPVQTLFDADNTGGPDPNNRTGLTYAWPGMPTPTGTLTFVEGTTLSATKPLDASGTTSLTASALTVGTHNILVSYSGDANYLAMDATQMYRVVVGQAATTTTVSAGPSPSTYGQPVTISATVAPNAPGSGTPTGALEFYVDGNDLGAGQPNGGGTYTFTTSALAIGNHSITASYQGDTNFAASTSQSPASQEVDQALAQINQVTTSPAIANDDAQINLTAIVRAVHAGAGFPSGTVGFFQQPGALPLGQATLTNGTATFTLAAGVLAPGTYSIVATYSGDRYFAATTVSPTATQVVKGPVANPDSYSTLAGATLSIPAPGVLGNDTSGNYSALLPFIQNCPSQGTVSLSSDGSFTYAPNAGARARTHLATRSTTGSPTASPRR